MDYKKQLEKTRNISDIFELVRRVVMESLGADQAGIMVGISDLGSFSNGFIGAFYAPHSNMIVINKRPLARITQANPNLYKYYLFHVILHEYIHSVGFYDEGQARQLVYEISNSYFGDSHIVTELARNIRQFMPHLSHDEGHQEPEDINIEFVKGIDRKNINYIN